jgi:uncharacterized membrane protein
MKLYRVSRKWRVLSTIAAILLILLFTWMFSLAFESDPKNDSNSFWFLILTSIALISLTLFGLVETIQLKLVIDDEKIIWSNTFSRRQLMFQEIKGFKLKDQYIVIEPIDGSKKEIKISTYFGEIDDIFNWLLNNYEDLSQNQTLIEKEEILNNKAFGKTRETRVKKVKHAFTAAKTLNLTGVAIGIWTFFAPNSYKMNTIEAIVFPIVTLFVLKWFHNLIKVDDKEDSAYPSVFLSLSAPICGLLLRVFFNFQVFDYSNVWIPCLLLSFAYLIVLIWKNTEFKLQKVADLLKLLSICLLIFGYSYAAIIALNCKFDKSESTVFRSKVLDRTIKSKQEYHLRLEPWGPQKEAADILVSKKVYDHARINDKVEVHLKKGLFGIPWLEVKNSEN